MSKTDNGGNFFYLLLRFIYKYTNLKYFWGQMRSNFFCLIDGNSSLTFCKYEPDRICTGFGGSNPCFHISNSTNFHFHRPAPWFSGRRKSKKDCFTSAPFIKASPTKIPLAPAFL